MSRYASIWFPHLLTEYVQRKNPALCGEPFVLASPQRGRMLIDAVHPSLLQKGIQPGMLLADVRAVFPDLQVLKSEPGRVGRLLRALAEWCIGYTPVVGIHMPDGLILDSSGCAHLWGGEEAYLKSLENRLGSYGYTVKVAIADTIGAAWAMARYGLSPCIVPAGGQRQALQGLPPAALRLDSEVLVRLKKLGLHKIERFMDMPRSALRRRFGPLPGLKLEQAFGEVHEGIEAIRPVESYQQRLASLEPIAHATGIQLALEQLTDKLCQRFESEGMGLRYAVLRAFRVDGEIQQIEIGTSYPSRNARHICKLFEHKIGQFRPELGFEMFVLEATEVENVVDVQSAIWNSHTQSDKKVSELLDRIVAKTGSRIRRPLPAAHYWPERSVKSAAPLWEKPETPWRTDCPRPVHVLPRPEEIEVSAAMPDYPPMLFRYKGVLHKVVRSEGPERIEQEWWIQEGLFRDYYCVEDEEGSRYWLFRSGPYDTHKPEWFIHGFFA